MILATLIWTYDMELVDKEAGWEEDSKEHVFWTKPPLMIRFRPVQRDAT